MAPPRSSLRLRRRRVSQRMSELCATLDTTQDAAHFACGTSYGLVRKGKTDEAAHSSVPPRRPARTVRVAEHLPETTRPRRASRAIRHEVDDGATPSRTTWDPRCDLHESPLPLPYAPPRPSQRPTRTPARARLELVGGGASGIDSGRATRRSADPGRVPGFRIRHASAADRRRARGTARLL